jgi:hypothetical protein
MVNLNFQFNQFFKFGTPIHKNQNLNLNLKEGQLGIPIHDIQSILKLELDNLNNSQHE